MKNALLILSGVALGLLGALGAAARPRGELLAGAQAQTAPPDGGGTSSVLLGTGGATPNQNDLCWVLFKEKGKDRAGAEHDRYALCLYKAMNGGQYFDLADVRELTYDPKPSQLSNPGHKLDLKPQVLKDLWEKAKREETERRRREEEDAARSRSRAPGGNNN
jgi:hypothetical protein